MTVAIGAAVFAEKIYAFLAFTLNARRHPSLVDTRSLMGTSGVPFAGLSR